MANKKKPIQLWLAKDRWAYLKEDYGNCEFQDELSLADLKAMIVKDVNLKLILNRRGASRVLITKEDYKEGTFTVLRR